MRRYVVARSQGGSIDKVVLWDSRVVNCAMSHSPFLTVFGSVKSIVELSLNLGFFPGAKLVIILLVKII